MAKYEIDMCRGPMFGKIILFSVPLILTGILQLLYNAADIVVVGQFAGKEALAAVGCTGSLTNLIVNLFMGLSIGTSVVVSKCYGARDLQGIQKAVHTSVTISAVAGVVLAFIGFSLARPLLTLMDTPPDVIDGSVLYMRIIFIGMPFNMVYNFGAAILRAVGDTRRPLYFLSFAGLVNVLLNLVFVIFFHMAVAGVALATITSQVISAFLVIRCLLHADNEIRLNPKRLKIHGRTLLEITRIGLPAGIQSALFAISNVLIQSSVNSFGSNGTAVHSAASNLEGFCYTSMNAIHQAIVTFVSQNLGAKQYKRMRRVMGICILIVVVMGGTMCNLIAFFRRPFLSIYNSDPGVLAMGDARLFFMPLYFLCGVMEVSSGQMRGMGYSITPMIVTLTGACLLRVVWIFTIFAQVHTMEILMLSYPVSWVVTTIAHYICYLIVRRKLPKEDMPLPAASAAV